MIRLFCLVLVFLFSACELVDCAERVIIRPFIDIDSKEFNVDYCTQITSSFENELIELNRCRVIPSDIKANDGLTSKYNIDYKPDVVAVGTIERELFADDRYKCTVQVRLIDKKTGVLLRRSSLVSTFNIVESRIVNADLGEEFRKLAELLYPSQPSIVLGANLYSLLLRNFLSGSYESSGYLQYYLGIRVKEFTYFAAPLWDASIDTVGFRYKSDSSFLATSIIAKRRNINQYMLSLSCAGQCSLEKIGKNLSELPIIDSFSNFPVFDSFSKMVVWKRIFLNIEVFASSYQSDYDFGIGFGFISDIPITVLF